MEFLRGIKEGLSRRSRKLGIAMALLVLTAVMGIAALGATL